MITVTIRGGPEGVRTLVEAHCRRLDETLFRVVVSGDFDDLTITLTRDDDAEAR